MLIISGDSYDKFNHEVLGVSGERFGGNVREPDNLEQTNSTRTNGRRYKDNDIVMSPLCQI